MVRRGTYEKLVQIKEHHRRPFSEQIAIWCDREIAAIQSGQQTTSTIPSDPIHGPQGSTPAPSSGHHPAKD
jgi:hypothetical protein